MPEEHTAPGAPETEAAPFVADVQVRRAPKYGVFLVLGGIVGVLVAMILTFVFDGSKEASDIGVTYSQSQVFGFLAMFCIVGGIALGAAVALILDRVVGRRSHSIRASRETIVEQD